MPRELGRSLEDRRWGGLVDQGQLHGSTALAYAWHLGVDELHRLERSRSNSFTTEEISRIAPQLGINDRSSIRIACYNDKRLNALATLDGDDYTVGVFCRLPQAYFIAALALWSNPSFAPWIGDPERLTPLTQNEQGLATVGNMLRQAIAFDSSSIWQSPWLQLNYELPQVQTDHIHCPRRMAAFNKVFMEAVRYTWLHEICHVACGHIDLLSEEGQQVLYEAEFAEEATSPPHLLRFLEHAADVSALPNIFTLNYSPAYLAGFDMDAPARLAEAISLSCVAAAIPFFVMHLTDVAADTPESASQHPPLWFRTHIAQLMEEEVRFVMRNRVPTSVVEAVPNHVQRMHSALSTIEPAFTIQLSEKALDPVEDYLARMHDATRQWHDRMQAWGNRMGHGIRTHNQEERYQGLRDDFWN